MTIKEKSIKYFSSKKFLILILYSYSLSTREYWRQMLDISLWVEAEASLPSLEFGIFFNILHMTSCRTPPTLRQTLLFSLRDWAIRKLVENPSSSVKEHPSAPRNLKKSQMLPLFNLRTEYFAVEATNWDFMQNIFSNYLPQFQNSSFYTSKVRNSLPELRMQYWNYHLTEVGIHTQFQK